MMRFAIDTCSLIALQYSGYLEVTFKNANLIITKKILSELEEMGNFSDDDSSAAREVLKSVQKMIILETQPKSTGEEELIEVALQSKCDFIVSDDIRAASKLCTTSIPVIFSTHLLYYLYRMTIISKDEGLIALEKMRNKRSWKKNLIYIVGIQLFK
ncbi:MAG: hypothetical protein OIN66_09240 [Candidatus Methanoperedens sp.]|nr:hypothetical protein [Candidatus Methanoperedens sp.]